MRTTTAHLLSAAMVVAALVPGQAQGAATGTDVALATGVGYGPIGGRTMSGTATGVGTNGLAVTYNCVFGTSGTGTLGGFEGQCGPLEWEGCLYVAAEQPLTMTVACPGGSGNVTGAGQFVFTPIAGDYYSFKAVLAGTAALG